MRSLRAAIGQINSIRCKANASSGLMPTGWERLKEVTLLSCHWHSLSFLHKASKAAISKACSRPGSEAWEPVMCSCRQKGWGRAALPHWWLGVGLGARGAPRAEQTELPTKMSKEVSQWCCWKRENEIPEKLMAQYSQSYCVFQARWPCALHKVILLWIGKGVSQRPATLIKYFLLILPQYLCGRGTRFYV